MSAQAVADARSAIEQIVYGYAELMDRGDFAGVAALFSRAHYRGAGPSDSGVEGAAAVQEVLETMVQRYDDGTPHTQHVTTNLVIDVDEPAVSARARSCFTVFQQVDTGVINPIIAGRYQDSYARDDSGWYLTERVFLTSLVGDLSAHLTVDPFSVA